MPKMQLIRFGRATALVTLGLLLSGCQFLNDYLGLKTQSQIAAEAEAEGKAVGGACRHAGRAIEDCYALNPALPRAAVFQGWIDMNTYMQEHGITEVPPVFEPPPPADRTPRSDPGTPTAPAAPGG